jgi:hypothetical protein
MSILVGEGGGFFSNLLEARVFVRFTPPKPMPLSWAQAAVRRFEQFVAFGTRWPCTATEEVARPIRVGNDRDDVDVPVHRRRFGVTGNDSRPLPLFWPARRPHSLAVLVEHWFAAFPRFAPVFDLMTSLTYAEPRFADAQFLILTQAAESLHRRMMPGLYVQPSEYDAIRTAVVKSIPETVSDSHRQSLRSRIQFGNEYSFRQRLRELVNGVADDRLRALIASDPAKFIGDVVDTRNYLVHYPEPPTDGGGSHIGPRAGGVAIFGLAERLRALITYHILVSILQFPVDEAARAVRTNQELCTGMQYYRSKA